MNKFFKILLFVFIGVVLVCTAMYVRQMHFIDNLEVIDEGKYYKTAVIDPEDLPEFIDEYKIKTVVDLRKPGTNDTILNPEKTEDVTAEREAMAKLPHVNYINLATPQVPSQETVDEFLKIIDNPDNYPMVVHCTHGTGRAKLFAALYKIEKLGYSPEEARKDTRLLVKFSSFDDGTPKGEFLKNYQPRRAKQE